MPATAGPSILGLFPTVGAIGGIEASGRIAIASLSSFCSSVNRTFQLLTYPSRRDRYSARAQALSRAFRMDAAEHVFVWHLSLLRLVKFLRKKPSSITVF